MAGYLVRRLRGIDRFEVTKWDLSDAPEAVYTVTARGRCSCPARGRCKHLKLVKRFLKEEKTRDPLRMYEA